MPSNGLNLEQILEARNRQDRARQMNTTTATELAGIFSLQSMRILGAYQLRLAGNVTALMSRPVGIALERSHPEDTHLITHNNSMYDDELEDRIAADPVIRAVTDRSRANPDDSQIKDVLRARRTVLAFLALASAEQPTPEEPAEITALPMQPLPASQDAARHEQAA